MTSLNHKSCINLDSAVKPREIAASTGALGYGKKVLFTNKVTTNFFPTPITPLATTLPTSSTAESRIKACLLISAKMFALVILGTLNSAALAAEHEVTNSQPDGIGSLADAIAQSRLIPGPDTIRFEQNYFSQIREISINKTLELEEDIEIIGPDKDLLTITAQSGVVQNLFRIEQSTNGNKGNVLFKNLSMQVADNGSIRLIYAVDSNVSLENVDLIGNSKVLSKSSGAAIAINNGNLSLKNCRVENFISEYRGGAIFAYFYNQQSFAINIDNCRLSNNAVVGPFNPSFDISGGAIYSLDTYFNSTMTIKNSEISHNSVTNAGGGIALIRQSATIINSTISNNSANNSGGGIFIANGSKPTGNELILQSSTVTENHSNNGLGGIGVAGANSRIRISIANSVIANNSTSGNGADEIGSSDLTASYSLIGDKPGDEGNFTFDNTVILNADPMLGQLANNGGTTRTHAILNNSPLIDAGDNNAYDYRITPPSYDQRGTGFARNQGSDTDIGAFEYRAATSCNSCGGGSGESGGGSIFFLLLPLTLLCLSKIRPTKAFGNAKGVNP